MTNYHFYHCYADGHWNKPIIGHVKALKESGLAENLDGFFVGIVGATPKRKKVINYLKKSGLDFEVCAEKKQGWEQVTQAKLYEMAQNHEGNVLYAHTKGAFDPSKYRDGWRNAMTKHNVYEWRECIRRLENNDAVGAGWLEEEPNKYPQHFTGTFWWSRFDFIRRLGPPSLGSRYDAEFWIGACPTIKVHDMCPDFIYG